MVTREAGEGHGKRRRVEGAVGVWELTSRRAHLERKEFLQDEREDDALHLQTNAVNFIYVNPKISVPLLSPSSPLSLSPRPASPLISSPPFLSPLLADTIPTSLFSPAMSDKRCSRVARCSLRGWTGSMESMEGADVLLSEEGPQHWAVRVLPAAWESISTRVLCFSLAERGAAFRAKNYSTLDFSNLLQRKSRGLCWSERSAKPWCFLLSCCCCSFSTRTVACNILINICQGRLKVIKVDLDNSNSLAKLCWGNS